MSKLMFFTFILCLVCVASSNRVLELSDRFLEIRNDGVWFVMFYAPWCGHCKQLDPIWNQVAQSLADSEIRVGKLDCTRFTQVAQEFSISGFPTVLFIKDHKAIEYKGDRNRYEIVNFARRMDGPAVRHFASCDQFEALRKEKTVFFVYINGEKMGGEAELKDDFSRLAEEFIITNSFYTSPNQCIANLQGIAIPKIPTVYVCKEISCFAYDENLLETENITLHDWINKERFPTFLKVTVGNFYQLLRSEKYLALGVLEENPIGGLSLRMSEFRDVLEAIAVNNKNIYHQQFIFGWLGQSDIANNIAMMTLPVPSFLIVNTTTLEYYLPTLEEGEKIPTPQSILQLLDQVKNGMAEALGGDTFFYKICRNYYTFRTSIASMWKGNPVLTTVLLGLPVGLLTVICYTTCCSDILEAEEEEEQEMDDQSHQKKE